MDYNAVVFIFCTCGGKRSLPGSRHQFNWHSHQQLQQPMFFQLFKRKPRSPFELKVTTIGSCLSNFIVTNYLQEQLPKGWNRKKLTGALQLRSDIVLDLLRQKNIDLELITKYLDAGIWSDQSDKQEYASWFSNFIKEKVTSSASLAADVPDLLVMDSLCDIRHGLYRNNDAGWKAFFGNIQFSNTELEQDFARNFEFIGFLSPEEQLANLFAIYDYFVAKNPNLKLVYMQFPLHPDYMEEKWLQRSEKFAATIRQGLLTTTRKIFFLTLPAILLKPLTDPTHPNYSPQIWNHFYPEVYQYFANEISTIVTESHKIKPSPPKTV